MEFESHDEMPMPLTSKELLVLAHCMTLALKSEQIKEKDKE
jgi:hypothetical protein